MFWGRILILFACPILLFCNTITFHGTLTKGVIDRYCIKPLADTSFEAYLTSREANCLDFIDSSGTLGEDCGTDSYLYADNVSKGKTYLIVTARLKGSPSSTYNYTLETNSANDVQVGLCPGQAFANAAGMSGEQMNFMLALSGLVIALMFFGSITYIILTIKEW